MNEAPKTLKRLGIFGNPEKTGAGDLIAEAVLLAEQSGCEVILEETTSTLCDFTGRSTLSLRATADHSDLLLVLGGDGTMLGAARSLAGCPTPLLGVNTGGLGFLTAIPGAQFTELWPGILQGLYRLEHRPLIGASGMGGGTEIRQKALNDFVISGGAASRLIELEVSVNGEVMTHYRCDGLIIASPTGSTAYSLAAGGAIIAPEADVLTLTPICPHTLSNRSVIVRMDAEVGVRVLTKKLEVYLTADGQVQHPMTQGDEVVISRAKESVTFARLPTSSFFTTLRQKLNWRGQP